RNRRWPRRPSKLNAKFDHAFPASADTTSVSPSRYISHSPSAMASAMDASPRISTLAALATTRTRRATESEGGGGETDSVAGGVAAAVGGSGDEPAEPEA